MSSLRFFSAFVDRDSTDVEFSIYNDKTASVLKFIPVYIFHGFGKWEPVSVASSDLCHACYSVLAVIVSL